MEGYADIADLPEDERITIIGRQAERKIVGFFVDDDEKADRYIDKLIQRFKIRVIERVPNLLVKNTVFVKVGPAES
jgi:hypothetical protein